MPTAASPSTTPQGPTQPSSRLPSPRTPRLTVRSADWLAPRPAHAGIDPTIFAVASGGVGFLRTRRDRPMRDEAIIAPLLFSPQCAGEGGMMAMMKLRRLSVSGRIILAMMAGLVLAPGAACLSGPGAPGPDDDGRGGDAPPSAVAYEADHESPGFSDDHVLFGQSAAFTGPAQDTVKSWPRPKLHGSSHQRVELQRDHAHAVGNTGGNGSMAAQLHGARR